MKNPVIWLFIALAFVPLMPSADSLWTDEGQTAAYVLQPSLTAVFERLGQDHFSEALMPLGMLYPWAAGKALGTSELALRLANLPWIVLLIVILWTIGREMQMPWLGLLAAVHPFVWAYANEARPYAMQLGAGVLAAYGVWLACSSDRENNKWLYLTLFAAVLLSFIGLLGVVTAGAATLVAFVVSLRRGWRANRAAWISFAVTILILGVLGTYYLWKLQSGAGGAKLWSFGLGNVAFTLYEFAGFSGIGPSRQFLRGAAQGGGLLGAAATLWPYLVGFGVLTLAYLVIVIQGGRRMAGPCSTRPLMPFFWTLFLATTGLFALAAIAHFPIWGRHHAPAFPFLLVVLALFIRSAWQGGAVARGAIVALFLTLLVSGTLLRFSPQHRKDDYRTAARLAKEAGHVWWSADPVTAEYYGLHPQLADSAETAVLTRNADARRLQELAPPRTVFLSKPEIYDPSSELTTFLREHDYKQVETLQAFTIWKREPAPEPILE